MNIFKSYFLTINVNSENKLCVCVCLCVVYRNISKELSDFECMEFANIFCNAHEPEIEMFTFKLIKNSAKKFFSELEAELPVERNCFRLHKHLHKPSATEKLATGGLILDIQF